MRTGIWMTRIAALCAVCAVAALAASGVAAPQGNGDHKDRHVQDKRQDKHGHNSDKGHSPKDHGKHDNGRHHVDKGRDHGHDNAGLRHRQELARLREMQRLQALHRHHHHVVYVTSHRNDDWKQIAAIAGLVAVFGLIEHDNTLVFVGAAGALYSLDRYNHDRHSRNRADRLRAVYFSRPYFYRDGHRYHRILVTSHRKRYYRFVRG